MPARRIRVIGMRLEILVFVRVIGLEQRENPDIAAERGRVSGLLGIRRHEAADGIARLNDLPPAPAEVHAAKALAALVPGGSVGEWIKTAARVGGPFHAVFKRELIFRRRQNPAGAARRALGRGRIVWIPGLVPEAAAVKIVAAG